MTLPRRRKLLLAIDSLTGGGAERVLADLANGLDRTRYEVEIVLALGTASVQEVASHVKVVVLPAPASGPGSATRMQRARAMAVKRLPLLAEVLYFRRMSARLARHIAASKPDCVIAFLANTSLLCLITRRRYRLKAPVIACTHVHLTSELQRLPWTRFRTFLTRRYFPDAVRHVAVSAAAADDLVERYGVDRRDVVTILNGIDVARIRLRASEPGDVLPRVSGRLRIVSVGRLNRAKAFDTLFHALSRLRTPDWELLLIGEGEESASLRELASRLAIADRVQFLGWQSNPYATMARSDLYVLSSRWEGLPLVILEALALGLPIIATESSPAVTDVLGAGQYGRLVPIDAPEALADAIDELASDADARDQLARRAAGRAATFDLPPMIAAYENLVEAVCGANAQQ